MSTIYKNVIIKILHHFYLFSYKKNLCILQKKGLPVTLFFDPNWYIRMYQDVAEMGIDPLWHYVRSGFKEGRFPSSCFHPGWYSLQEGFNGSREPLLHFISVGWKRGLKPNPYFGISRNLAAEGEDGSIHEAEQHVRKMVEQGRIKMKPVLLLRSFDITRGIKALTKYSTWRRTTKDYFDMDYYQKKVSRWTKRRVTAWKYHFFGWRMKIDPMPLFSVSWYLEQNPDVFTAGVEPLNHFISIGKEENRDPHPLFYNQWYEKNAVEKDVHVGVGLLSYLKEEWTSELDPNPFFDNKWYLETYLKGDKSQNPLLHYLETGWQQGAEPYQGFDTQEYLRLYPEAAYRLPFSIL